MHDAFLHSSDYMFTMRLPVGLRPETLLRHARRPASSADSASPLKQHRRMHPARPWGIGSRQFKLRPPHDVRVCLRPE
eukprot:7705374-Alexandrium_andersonii.AAC.1